MNSPASKSRNPLQFGLRTALVLMAVAAVLAATIGIPLARARRETMLRADLRAIALAMHNYHDVHRRFPPAYLVDAQGQPAHSWRVLLLPMFSDPVADKIYADYDFSQPWDSPVNQAATAKMPGVYRHPARRDSKPITDYMAIVGDGAVFDPTVKRIRMADILDGTSNTLLLVEVVGSTTHWAQPQDLALDKLPRKINASRNGDAISGRTKEGAYVAFADGAVVFLHNDLDPETLRRLLLRDDSKPIPYDVR